MASSTPPPKQALWRPSDGVVFAAGRQPSSIQAEQRRSAHSLAEEMRHSATRTKARTAAASTFVREVVIRSKGVAGTPRAFGTAADGQSESQAGDCARTAGDSGQPPDDADSDEPPLTSLDFDIPSEAFRAARSAAPGTPESFWSYSLYRGPGEDGDASKVKVHYCRSRHTAERVCQYFLGEEVLGFDLEWASDASRHQGPRKNVSLIQLASPGRIALFHLALFPGKRDEDLVPPTFRRIMEDPGTTKAGVWIKGDCTRLRNFLGVQSRGIFELSHLYKLVRHSSSGRTGLIDKKLVSLATQVEDCLRLPMFKGQDVRSSDWTQPLRMDQIIYAASDAYAAVQLYAILDHQRELLDPTPPRPYHAELNLPIRLADGASVPAPEEPAGAEEIKAAAKVPAALTQAYLAAAGESVEVETDGDDAGPPPRPAAGRPAPRPGDGRIAAAEAWMREYRAAAQSPRAAPAALRAYRIWQANGDLDPPAVAALLRDPPLRTATVAGYILEAVKLEKLPYDPRRLRDEVLSQLPREVLASRYKALLRAAEGA